MFACSPPVFIKPLVCALRKYKYGLDKQHAINLPLQTIDDFMDCVHSLGRVIDSSFNANGKFFSLSTFVFKFFHVYIQYNYSYTTADNVLYKFEHVKFLIYVRAYLYNEKLCLYQISKQISNIK